MAQLFEHRHHVQAWTASAVLHGVGATVVWMLIAQMRPLPPQETFQWNVSLVEALQESSIEPAVKTVPPSVSQSHTHRMDSASVAAHPAKREVQTMSLPTVVAAQPQQPLKSAKVLERPSSQGIMPFARVHQEPVVEQQRVIQETQPVERTQEIVTSPMAADMPDTLATPITETREVASTYSTHAMVAAPSATATYDIEPPGEAQGAEVVAVPKQSITPSTQVESTQLSYKEVQRVPATRPDYGWLIDSLGARLSELKRYPAAARSGGLEGKVLLRVVIRADGYVAEVAVKTSSGHEELDAAATQTMREASPLHLRHELGRAQIAITVPLVYKLTN